MEQCYNHDLYLPQERMHEAVGQVDEARSFLLPLGYVLTWEPLQFPPLNRLLSQITHQLCPDSSKFQPQT